tara:strand:- start:2663 stop:2941 length:279 start_codon:yes stop_codon:yes gene_type:complete
MREINTENDDHVFKITVKDKGTVFVDGFELASACSELPSVQDGGDPKSDEIAEAIKTVCWLEGETSIDMFTKHELFAVGTKALMEIQHLGNA